MHSDTSSSTCEVDHGKYKNNGVNILCFLMMIDAVVLKYLPRRKSKHGM